MGKLKDAKEFADTVIKVVKTVKQVANVIKDVAVTAKDVASKVPDAIDKGKEFYNDVKTKVDKGKEFYNDVKAKVATGISLMAALAGNPNAAQADPLPQNEGTQPQTEQTITPEIKSEADEKTAVYEQETQAKQGAVQQEENTSEGSFVEAGEELVMPETSSVVTAANEEENKTTNGTIVFDGVEIQTTENTRGDFQRSTAQATINEGNTSTEMSVDKTISSTDEKTVVSTTERTVTEGARKQSMEQTNTLDTYSNSGGHSHTESTVTSETETTKKGRVKKSHESSSETHTSQQSSLAEANGYTGESSTTNNQSYDATYNRKGDVKKSSSHVDIQTDQLSYSHDEQSSYNKKGDVKKSTTVTAENGTLEIQDKKGKKEFIATENSDGSKEYSMVREGQKYYHVTDVSVDADGNTEAKKYKIDKNNENPAEAEKIGEKKLNHPEQMQEKMEERADKAVQRVSDAQSAEEYRQQTANNSAETKQAPLSAHFEQQSPETLDAQKEVEAQRASEMQSQIAEQKNNKADKAVVNKIMELRGLGDKTPTSQKSNGEAQVNTTANVAAVAMQKANDGR